VNATDSKGPAPRAGPLLLGLLLVATGVLLLGGGIWLIVLGGSWYYALAGGAALASGWLVISGSSWGGRVYALTLLGTLVWSVAQWGADPWTLSSSLLAPCVVGLGFALPGLRRLSGTRPRAARIDAAAIVSLLVLVFIALRFAQLVAAQNDLPDADIGSPAGNLTSQASIATEGEWPHYGRTLSGERFSPLTQITPQNVSQLKLAWVHRSGEVAPKGNIADESTPLKIGDTLYTCTPHSAVIAIDAKSGKERWRFEPKVDVDSYYFSICRGLSYYHEANGTGACADRIITTGIDGYLRALDAQSGRLCADFGVAGAVPLREHIGEIRTGYYIWTSPPVIVQSHIILGSTVYDNQAVDMPSGVIRSYDAQTGALQWAWDMGVPERIRAPSEGENYTRGTPNSWPPFSADEALGLVYLPMGNPAPDYFGGLRRAFDEKYGSSLVALSVADGRPRWSYQTTRHDLWDYDLPAQPVLVDIPGASGEAIPVVVQPTKRGDIFVLDRRDGTPIVPVSEYSAPRSSTPGDWASKTQPVSGLSFMPARLTEQAMWGATPLDALVCRIEFRRARYEGPFTPPGLGTSIQYPGLDGSINWGSVSIDDDRKIMVSSTADMPWYVRLVPREQVHDSNPDWPQRGTPYVLFDGPFLGPLEMPCMRPPWGHIAAIDLKTRRTLWRRELGTSRDTGPFGIHVGPPLPIGIPSIGGSLVTRSGLIFVGATLDNYLRALDIRSGRELWRVRLPAGGQAVPMTYMEGGKQYVIITAGGHLVVRTQRGDYTMAFALPD
jgi:quinoprotein glucose dehydrogenase